jgi:hypothetical protein
MQLPPTSSLVKQPELLEARQILTKTTMMIGSVRQAEGQLAIWNGM